MLIIAASETLGDPTTFKSLAETGSTWS